MNYYIETGPVCPYCGHENEADESDGILYDESTSEYNCDMCDREFNVTVFVSYSWVVDAISHRKEVAGK